MPITDQEVKDIISSIKDSMKEVPFGNSQYQINSFIIGKEHPSRQYRNCLLQIDSKLKALHSCMFNRRRLELDIAELIEEIDSIKNSDTSYSKYHLTRKEIDLEEKQYNLGEEDKLIEDAVIELNTYYKHLKTLQPLTREEFEQSEKDHWQSKFMDEAMRELISTGTVDKETIRCLSQTGIGTVRDKDNRIGFAPIELLLKQGEESNG